MDKEKLKGVIDKAPMLQWFKECREGVGGDYGFFSAGCEFAFNYILTNCLPKEEESWLKNFDLYCEYCKNNSVKYRMEDSAHYNIWLEQNYNPPTK